jgi:hypothetical protein
VSEWFLALTAFAGFNLFQSGFTGFCPPAILFKKAGCARGRQQHRQELNALKPRLPLRHWQSHVPVFTHVAHTH